MSTAKGKPTGRPKQFTVVKRVRLDDAQARQLHALATAKGVPEAEVLRGLLDREPAPPPRPVVQRLAVEPEMYERMIAALAEIRTPINRGFARMEFWHERARAAGKAPQASELAEAVSVYEEARQLVRVAAHTFSEVSPW